MGDKIMKNISPLINLKIIYAHFDRIKKLYWEKNIKSVKGRLKVKIYRR